jgi:uncharacterized protein (TIGR04442 family)
MVRDFMLHGSIGPIDFYAFVAGADVSSPFFYEERGTSIRFFLKGNELTLSQDGVTYKGTGGTFCEYMFGVEKPYKDMIRQEVVNRLGMFGAFLKGDERLVFTNEIQGFESYRRLFLLGHAVKNYFFLVSSERKEKTGERQRYLLQVFGKLLKRSSLISDEKESELLNRLVSELNEPKSTVLLFKLIHRGNREFYRAFHSVYSRERNLTEADETRLKGIAVTYDIENYQQERMKIDDMYKHPENRRVIDEYLEILLTTLFKENIQDSVLARLQRLRMLSIRNNIPSILFDTLDEVLLKDNRLHTLEEMEYLKESRTILEKLFFNDSSIKKNIIKKDIARLIWAKHMAHVNNDKGFERIILDLGKECDEFAKEHNDFSIIEEFSSIITHFDRYDNINASLSRIAFVEKTELTESTLRSIIEHKKEFDAIDTRFFRELFVREIFDNNYITNFGKRKIKVLSEGIEKIASGNASLKDIVEKMEGVAEEERIYRQIHDMIKEKMGDIYTSLDMTEGLQRVYKEITHDFRKRGVPVETTERIFRRALLDLKKESYYLNYLIPRIVKSGDLGLREDFLVNSGLDRFYIEALEKGYLAERGFAGVLLESTGKQGIFNDIGGGERI